MQESAILIKSFEEIYLKPLVRAFKNYGGDKSEDKFKQVLQAQTLKFSSAWIVFSEKEIAGYVLIHWDSCLGEFDRKKIPEISDLNVLPKFRGKGIATKLLDEIEKIILERSSIAGIGVGLTKDYGNAQRLYIRRGYLPLGIGLTYKYKPIDHGQNVLVDDDLVFWFTKKLG